MKISSQKTPYGYALRYVETVGKTEAKNSVHYATGKICKCKNCFCCHVFGEVNRSLEEETLRRAVQLASERHAEKKMDLFFDHVAHGSELD